MNDVFVTDDGFDGVFGSSAGQHGSSGNSIGFSVDVNGDGLNDVVYETADLNNDGLPDVQALDVDLNAEGIKDVSITSIDFDGDGNADFTSMQLDADGDGVVDAERYETSEAFMLAVPDASQEIWGEVAANVGQDQATAEQRDSGQPGIEALSLTYDNLTFEGFEGFYAMHGTPAEDLALWDQQDGPCSCAVATTNMMFASLGLEVGEGVLAEEFMRQGIYDVSSGTNPHLIPDAINAFAYRHGLEVEAFSMTATSVVDFEQALDAGYRPLVSVDAIEIHGTAEMQLLNDFGRVPDQGHAVQLIGIEHTPNGSYAILNDPDYAAGMKVPMDRFLEATADFGGLCVAMGGKESIPALPHGTDDSHENGKALLAGMTEPLHSDVFGNVYRGNSIIPVATYPMG